MCKIDLWSPSTSKRADKANVINPRPGKKSQKQKAGSIDEKFIMSIRKSSRKLRLIITVIIIVIIINKKKWWKWKTVWLKT